MTADDRPIGIFRALVDLLSTLDDRGERTRHGRWSGDRTTVEYSISVGGLGEAQRSGRQNDLDGPAITTREVEDGLLVAADLPGVSADDVSVDLDGADRVIRMTVRGDTLGRIPLEDGDWTVVDVSFNNDIMEVRLTHE